MNCGNIASMRPRVFPAEDRESVCTESLCTRASMRPRVFPAEDVGPLTVRKEDERASMRPRVFPAEDFKPRLCPPLTSSRFNEAAGIPRGRPGRERRVRRVARGFNEAAGIPRGRQQTDLIYSDVALCFNEAAGIPRGEDALHQEQALLIDTSLQ